MSKYIKVTMIFEPGNGSGLDIDTLKEAVTYSTNNFVPQSNFSQVKVLDTDDLEDNDADL